MVGLGKLVESRVRTVVRSKLEIPEAAASASAFQGSGKDPLAASFLIREENHLQPLEEGELLDFLDTVLLLCCP